MKKKIFTGLVVLASMICSTSFAQDIYKTAAGVPMVQLNNGILMPQFGLGTFLQPSDEVFNKIMNESTVKPAVLQIECHPYAQRLAMREKVKPYGIHITCWFPLGGAMSNGALFKDPTIMEIAKAHGKTAAQVILRWHIQEGFSVIPGASNPDYIEENIDIFDFTLTDDEMAEMRGLNKERRFFNMSLSDVERMVGL